MSLSGRLARAVANIGKSKPYVGLAGARQEDWQKPVARVGAEKEKSASCLPLFHRGCFLLVPLFTAILSALLPPWMFLARAILSPLLLPPYVELLLLVALLAHPSLCHHCHFHLGCFLLVPLLTLISSCCPCSHLGLFLLSCHFWPSSCHHRCYHLGHFLLVPLARVKVGFWGQKLLLPSFTSKVQILQITYI